MSRLAEPEIALAYSDSQCLLTYCPYIPVEKTPEPVNKVVIRQPINTEQERVLHKPVETKEVLKVSENNSSLTENCEQFRSLISQYDWNVEVAMEVCKHESRGNTRAKNNNPSTGDYSIGLFQINMLWHHEHTEEELKDPATNVAKAYREYKTNKWRPWSVCKSKVRCS